MVICCSVLVFQYYKLMSNVRRRRDYTMPNGRLPHMRLLDASESTFLSPPECFLSPPECWQGSHFSKGGWDSQRLGRCFHTQSRISGSRSAAEQLCCKSASDYATWLEGCAVC